jgi:hypothetical protein
VGLFSVLVATLITTTPELFVNQPDFVSPTTQDREVVSYFSANNLTVYSQTWSFTLTYPGSAQNDSGLNQDHRIEFYWQDYGDAFHPLPAFKIDHAYPSIFGTIWYWSNPMFLTPGYKAVMGNPDAPWFPALESGSVDYGWIDEAMLLRAATNANSSYFEVSDGEVTANFLVTNPGNYSSLSAAYNGGYIKILSSYELDFDAMKPNAFWLFAQLVFFQNPDFGLPGYFGEIISYGMALAFWVIIAMLIYTMVTKLIPTIQGGIEG